MKEFFSMTYVPAFWVSLICGLIYFILRFKKIRELDQPWVLGIIVLASFTPMVNVLSAFISIFFAIEAIGNGLNRLKAKNRLKRIKKSNHENYFKITNVCKLVFLFCSSFISLKRYYT